MKISFPPLKKLNPSTKRPFCKICFKDITSPSLTSLNKENINICNDCFKKMEYSLKEEIYYEHKLIYLNNYTPFFSSLLIQYKETLDIELAPIFLERYSMLFHLLFFTYKLVLIPSSQSNIDRRGFNHLEEMTKCLNLEYLNVLYKEEGSPQKHLGHKQRLKSKSLFHIKQGNKITNKKILLFDDVLTTGTSLKACLDLIEKYKPKKVVILILSKVIS